MKSIFAEYKKTYIFFGLSLLIYFVQDLLSLTLQVNYVELTVISFLLSMALLLVSFCSLLIVSIKSRLRNPGIILGVVILFVCNFAYSQMLVGTKVNLYFHTNREGLNSLVEEAYKIDNDNEAVRIYNEFSYVRLNYWDVFLADHQPLESLMDTLQVHEIRKYLDYTELTVLGYSSRRFKELTLVQLLDRDNTRIITEKRNQPSVVQCEHIDKNWYFITYNHKSLHNRHAYWGDLPEQRAENLRSK